MIMFDVTIRYGLQNYKEFRSPPNIFRFIFNYLILAVLISHVAASLLSLV